MENPHHLLSNYPSKKEYCVVQYVKIEIFTKDIYTVFLIFLLSLGETETVHLWLLLYLAFFGLIFTYLNAFSASLFDKFSGIFSSIFDK